jgi:hypothetical protein
LGVHPFTTHLHGPVSGHPRKHSPRHNLRLEKGMNVEVASAYSNPLTTDGDKGVIATFQRFRGLDLSKMKKHLNSSCFEAKKLN